MYMYLITRYPIAHLNRPIIVGIVGIPDSKLYLRSYIYFVKRKRHLVDTRYQSHKAQEYNVTVTKYRRRKGFNDDNAHKTELKIVCS